MKKAVLLFFMVCFAVSALAEFRIWHNKKGKSVEAEYKGMKDGKAVLVQKDGREFEVDPEALSSADQDYLQSVSDAPDVSKSTGSTSPEQPIKWISAADADGIAQKYISLIKGGFKDELKKMFVSPDDIDQKRLISSSSVMMNVYKVQIKKASKTDHGYDVQLIFQACYEWDSGKVSEHEDNRWLQMFPDGRIKYDDNIRTHPVRSALQLCKGAILCAKEKINFPSADKLTSTGIPLFGYDPSADFRDQIRALKKIENWLENDAFEWDVNDPKIPRPRDAYKYWDRTYIMDSSGREVRRMQ